MWVRMIDPRMVRTSHETFCVHHQSNIDVLSVMPLVAQGSCLGVPSATGCEECHSRRGSEKCEKR